jgi:hypothetical protein
VEVGSNNASIWLREGASIAPGSRYTAFSHSWGRREDPMKPVPKTTKEEKNITSVSNSKFLTGNFLRVRPHWTLHHSLAEPGSSRSGYLR